jgi:putative (di)nucleoside polyphosphate hydrolase
MLNLIDMSTRYYRAGVGTVIYNDANEIAIFKRSKHPIGTWELQQGGIDVGEVKEETLWRELHEEIGILPEDIEHYALMPGQTIYQSTLAAGDADVQMLGQVHSWFFLKLKNSSEIDLEKSTEDEASEFRWTNFDELISLAGDHKKHVYETLHRYFKEHILK